MDGTGAETKERISKIGIRGLWAFTGLTLLGFATFGANPQLLARFPQFAGLYGEAFRFFSVGHVWLAFIVLVVFLALYAGGRWVPAFVAAYLISLGSELLGTGTGLPFGAYEYTALMEPKWVGRVPIVIPLSWFYMALPAYALALRYFGGRGWGAPGVWVAGALGLVLWDLSLDPAMSYATPYWTWAEGGLYYGMPFVNLAGWFATGIALMASFAALGAQRWVTELPARWLGSFYLANLILPLGMNLAAGLWGAVASTLAALGVAWLVLNAGGRVRLPRPGSGVVAGAPERG